MAKSHKFTVKIGDEVWAEVEGTDRGQALHEAMHYLLQAAADGSKAKIEGVTPEDYNTYLKPVGVVVAQ